MGPAGAVSGVVERRHGSDGKSKRWGSCSVWLIAALVLPWSVNAEVSSWQEEYGNRLKYAELVKPLEGEIFGERINLYDGSISFAETDVSLPGNNDLPVGVARSLDLVNRVNNQAFGDWELDIPSISGLFGADAATVSAGYWAPAKRCSTVGPPPSVTVRNKRDTYDIGFADFEYWEGTRLSLPGGGGGELLGTSGDARQTRPSLGMGTPWNTKEGWFFSCLSALKSGQSGEGFLGHAPDGSKYYFDWMVVRSYEGATKQLYAADSYAYLPRNKVYLYPSQIVDRFGNWVRYDWAGSQLQRIHSSDGRSISLTYDAQGRIATVTTGSRRWTYHYDVYSLLASVVLPDGTSWTYNIPRVGLTYKQRQTQDQPESDYKVRMDLCAKMGILVDTEAVYSINHPSGAIGTFKLRPVRHGRYGVPFDCQENGIDGTVENGWNRNPLYRDAYALSSRTISGPALPTAQWQYQYLNLGGRYNVDVTSANWTKYPRGSGEHKLTVETAPDGTVKTYEYGKEVGYNDGRLLSVATQRDGTTVRTESTTYYPEESLGTAPFPALAGTSYVYGSGDVLTHQNRPVQSTRVVQDGVEFASQTTAFDAFVRPTAVVESNSAGQSRTTTQEYYDNLSLWKIGQTRRTTVGGIEDMRAEFDAATALPIRFYKFGKLSQSIAYAADGSVASVSDGRGNATLLSAWKFGIPQQLKFPPTPEALNGAARMATVNDDGWISAMTDENGFTTSYGYDPMGRLTEIRYPQGDSTAWNSVTLALGRLGTAMRGLPAGAWLHTRTQGGRVTQTYLDALFRPVLVNELASGQPASAVVNRYDAAGNKVFVSYPVREVGDVGQSLAGTTTSYDALGRPVAVSQASELGALVTRTEYIGNLDVRLTNPRGMVTTSRHLVYAEPTYDRPLSISQPEGVVTEIQRNTLGNPVAITRRSSDGSQQLARRYVYDGNQQLCKTIEPETGATVLAYDAAGNLAWSAAGTALTSAGSCDTSSAQSSGRAVTRGYDARNRLSQLRFPDGRGDQDWSYTPDGLPATVTTRNDSSALPVVNSYQYNRRRLLLQETQQHAVLGARTLGYVYDANGALASMTYPSGRVVAYAPDALGRPTQAGSYATSVSYHPNGAMARFVYGNGVVHTLAQNARGLPDRSIDQASSGPVLDDGYDYDASGNVMAISDGVAGGAGNRDMTYDGLDRLKTVNSPGFGGANYTYDALDNLRSAKVGARNRSHVFDANNRLTNVVDAGSGATVIGLGYDVQGNLRNRNGVVYDFDYGNRLRQVTGVETYQYDAQGRRVVSALPGGGSIYSFYDNGGVLRSQRNERTGKDVDYIHLNGSLVARVHGNLVPTVPTLSAPAYINQSGFTVSWSAVGAATRYELQEAANGGSWISIYSGAGLSKPVSGKGTGSYQYRVRACRDNCGNWSNVATVAIELAPSQVPALSVPQYGDNGAYSVGWGTSGGATRYELEESASGGAWTQSYSGTATSKPFSGRAAGNYGYRVRACNPIGCTAYSATGTVSVVYPPGTTPTITAPPRATMSGYTVGWSTISGATRYTLQESANGGAWSTLQDAAATSFGSGGRGVGSYGYRVAACNRAGCGAWSGTVTVSVIAPPSLEPTLSAPGVVSGTSYTVSWSTPAGTESFQLEESGNGGSWGQVYAGVGTSWGTSRGKGSYAYRVRACNFAGCGPYSGVVTVVVSPPPATPSFYVANWLTTVTAPYQVWCEVGWHAVADATEYQVQSWAGRALYTGPKTYVAANGNAYCSYDYKVRACNTGGCSAWSSPAYLVTQGQME
ncbi:wall-associated protein [[Pseudomonas] boreopolis]